MFIIHFSPNSDAWCPRFSDSNPYFCPPNSHVVGTRHRQRKRLSRRRQCCTNQGYEAGGAEGINQAKKHVVYACNSIYCNVIQYNVMSCNSTEGKGREGRHIHITGFNFTNTIGFNQTGADMMCLLFDELRKGTLDLTTRPGFWLNYDYLRVYSPPGVEIEFSNIYIYKHFRDEFCYIFIFYLLQDDNAYSYVYIHIYI